MSHRVLHTIEMDLSVQSINNAIKEVNYFREQLEQMCIDLAKKLVDDGVEIAKMQVVSMDAWFTGALEQSIKGIYLAEKHCGYVYTNSPHALFVEFGTGYVGEQGQKHPMHGEVGWAHDINEHGAGGWWYPADFGWYIPEGSNTKLAWTNGMEARPFMYNTMKWLEEVAEREGIDMFGR